MYVALIEFVYVIILFLKFFNHSSRTPHTPLVILSLNQPDELGREGLAEFPGGSERL